MKAWPVIVIFALLVTGGGVYVMNRNVRNNNPLNIEYNRANDWRGQTGNDGRFAVFDTVENGFRAAAKILHRYQSAYGLRTIREIIHRWAPPAENDSDQYAQFVAERLGIDADASLSLAGDDYTTAKMMLAMADMEGAKGKYTMAQALAGVQSV